MAILKRHDDGVPEIREKLARNFYTVNRRAIETLLAEIDALEYKLECAENRGHRETNEDDR